MAMSYADQVIFYNNVDWQDAVRQAMVDVARAIRIEGASIPGHDLRSALALQATASPNLWKQAFTAAAATILDDSTPTDLELGTAVEEVWDDLAGVPGPTV